MSSNILRQSILKNLKAETSSSIRLHQLSFRCFANSAVLSHDYRLLQNVFAPNLVVTNEKIMKTPNSTVLLANLLPVRKKNENSVEMLITNIRSQLREFQVMQSDAIQSNVEIKETVVHEYSAMNRNRRKGKRANSGKRPCSRHKRRSGRRTWSNPRR